MAQSERPDEVVAELKMQTDSENMILGRERKVQEKRTELVVNVPDVFSDILDISAGDELEMQLYETGYWIEKKEE